MRAVLIALSALVGLLVLVGVAHAETLEAPIAGKPISLGDARIACAPAVGGWGIEGGGHLLRPPALAIAVGTVAEQKVAPSAADCAKSEGVVSLVATAAWPAVDGTGFTLAVDEGRLDGKGKGMKGVLVTWQVDGGNVGSDTCRDPKTDGGVDACTWGVPKTLAADPSASALHWLPAGARAAADAVIFNADGRKAQLETFAITPSRVEIAHILPGDASVDVSPGVGLVPLLHADAVAGVDCGTTRCAVDNGMLSVQAPPASATSLDIKFRLLPHVIYTGKSPADVQPILKVSILRCPMSVISGPVLRGLESARVVVDLGGACASAVGSLRFFIGTRRAEVVQVQRAKDESFAVLGVGSVDTPSLSITVARGEGDGSVVAVARTDTRAAPKLRTVLEIADYPPVDFIPNNRTAVVHFPRVPGAALALLPQDNVYDAQTNGDVTTVRGDVDAAGLVVLVFGYRVPTLPPPLDQVDLAILLDSLQRNVKEANLPAPIGATAGSIKESIVEMLCTDGDGHPQRIEPGVAVHLPFSVREGCRIVIHRERLSANYGTQKLSLEIEIDKLDGTSRGDAHVSQTIILRAGTESRVAWIKGVRSPYDRIVVRLSHVADEAHYLGALEIATGVPAVQWSVVLGTGHVRLYATSAIPTGLYRFGTHDTSGVLSLSFGIISRFTWLDVDGHEGLLGLEAGVMAFGLTGDSSSTGQSLTQVGAVVGLGLAIPITNSGSPTQAAINLHGWVEQRLTGAGGTSEAGSKQAIIFGPSISIGNIGTTF